MVKSLRFGRLAIVTILAMFAIQAMPRSVGWTGFCALDEQHCTDCCDKWAECCEKLGGTPNRDTCSYQDSMCYGAECPGVENYNPETCEKLVQ
jgi:hypothetical protein